MLDKDPQAYSLWTYAVMLGTAMLGGLVNFIGGVRAGRYAVVSIQAAIGELMTSAFAGLICFWLCEWAQSPKLLTAALVGISGHMGSRAIAMFEGFAAKKFGIDLPTVAKPEPPKEPPR